MGLASNPKSNYPRDTDAVSYSAAARNLRRDRSAHAVQKISALGEMTGGIAHDFGNILAVIASGLRVAQDNAGDSSKRMAALAAANDGVERGQRMISRLLAFARQQELHPGPEDVNALLDKLAMFLKYGAGAEIRVVLELAPDLPKCLVDPPQFNAAILNLVVNARDAMPAGGTIRITTSAVVRRQNRNYVRVRISDDGAGMSPDVRKRIFDPYFTTKGESGTGLGIPQVQALMRQVGGYLTVNSKVGKGTSFDLFFPVHVEQPAAAPDAWRQLDRWADEGGAILPVKSSAAA
jgi:signal transduction histidine kinase